MKSRTALPALVLAIAVIPLAAPPARASPPDWRWPLDGHPRILRRFTPPPEPWLAGHRGIDLAAPASTPVLAAGPGTVRFAGAVAGKGVVTIDHEGGLRTTYLPVAASVKRGQQLTTGAELGVIEPSGSHCQESCLHWGLLRDARYLNPLLLLGHVPIRLLPFWPSAPARTTPPSPLHDLPVATAATHNPPHRLAASTASRKSPGATPPSPLNGYLTGNSSPHAAPAIGLALTLLGAFLLIGALHRRRHHRARTSGHSPREGRHRKNRHRRHGGGPRTRRSRSRPHEED
ncbi:murein hydrolase activator EnvC family protein [Nonomuraea sp. NPDC049480]|uniref:murein hydrolase activator EnvC family protein n=1 Tax=Nonomuraea sp. NPDC049480 TaxID=3364353 RepID=UPI0037BAB848